MRFHPQQTTQHLVHVRYFGVPHGYADVQTLALRLGTQVATHTEGPPLGSAFPLPGQYRAGCPPLFAEAVEPVAARG